MPPAEGPAQWRDSESTTAEQSTSSLYDFPRRLKRLQEESGLPWAEIARRLDL